MTIDNEEPQLLSEYHASNYFMKSNVMVDSGWQIKLLFFRNGANMIDSLRQDVQSQRWTHMKYDGGYKYTDEII
jgi:hypothetical protein